MKILMCQVNTTPGDFEGNIQQIKDGITKAFQEQADLVVFPELTIPGYLVRDMIYEKGFVERNLRALQEIVAHYDINYFETKDSRKIQPVVIVGYIDYNHTGIGKPFMNKAAVINKGVIEATYTKQLLPFYDVFDEGRYFEPGKDLTVITVAGQKFGIIICEDGWNDKGMDDYNYRVCPLERYREIGINNIISINSSPFVKGKPERRIEMFSRSSTDGILIYVNQIGGQDELVFDGNSFVCQNERLVSVMSLLDSETVYKGVSVEPFSFCHNVNRSAPEIYFTYDPIEMLYEVLKLGLKDYLHKTGFKEIVIGSSGGIDSAVVLALAKDVLGGENVHGIRMPSVYSSEGSKDDALQLHKNLGCWDYLVPIFHTDPLRNVNSALITTQKAGGFWEPDKVDNEKSQKHLLQNCIYHKVADENWQARERGRIVMHFSNAYGVLPLTTGNKTELALGYCTLYGDMNGGFAPINDLYKLDVQYIARYINIKAGREIIPVSIIDKAPSAELAPGQTDEASLLPYPILDPIVRCYIENYIGDFPNFVQYVEDAEDYIYEYDNLLEWMKVENAEKQYDRMIRLIKLNEFKRRQAAPGIKVCSVAFGTGRRLPIVKK